MHNYHLNQRSVYTHLRPVRTQLADNRLLYSKIYYDIHVYSIVNHTFLDMARIYQPDKQTHNRLNTVPWFQKRFWILLLLMIFNLKIGLQWFSLLPCYSFFFCFLMRHCGGPSLPVGRTLNATFLDGFFSYTPFYNSFQRIHHAFQSWPWATHFSILFYHFLTQHLFICW